MYQENLFDDLERTRADKELSENFWDFHSENMMVYIELRRLALKGVRAGRKRLGIKMLFEVLRWNRMIKTKDPAGDEFKLNNNYHSRYARLLMDRVPDLAGVFNLRELKTK